MMNCFPNYSKLLLWSQAKKQVEIATGHLAVAGQHTQAVQRIQEGEASFAAFSWHFQITFARDLIV